MNNWPIVKLGEVITHRKEFIEIDDLRIYKRCRVQLHVKGIVLRDEIEGALIKTKQQQACRTNEFLVAEIDAKVGGYGIVPPELCGAIVSSHYFLFTIDESKLEPQFLGYYIKTHLFRNQVSAQGTTNYAAIRPQHVLNYTISLPPLSEQRRIVAKIEQLVAKIEETNRIRHMAAGETDSFIMAEVKSIFLRVENHKPLVGSGAAILICGQHLSPTEQAESGTPYLTGPADFGIRVALPSRFAAIEKATSEDGDVLLTVKGAGVGKVNLAPKFKTVIGRQLFAVRPNEEMLDQIFLWYALQYCLKDLREAITATTVPGIGKNDVEQLRIPLLPLDEQRRIVAYLDGLQAQVDRLKALQAKTAAELEALLPAILDQAFKGEL